MTARRPAHSWLLPLLATLAVLGSAGCQPRDDSASPAMRPPGTISVPFRNRWWHFYERGLSWAEASHDAEAEADFRQCLALRQTDSRLARTYGMHFVQCFAHRELGALLLRQQRLDEAEHELRLSQEQEPSAKAEALLERLRAQRSGVPAPASTTAQILPHLTLTGVTPAPGAADRLAVSGQLVATGGSALWSVDSHGIRTAVPFAASGTFRTEVEAGSTLTLDVTEGPAAQTAPSLTVVQPSQVGPNLELDGPDDSAVIADGQAWYRWRVAAAAGLAGMEIADEHGHRLASIPTTGLRAAGTTRIGVPAGRHELTFICHDLAGGSASTKRSVEARPAPQQDRGLRAVAVAIPLATPRPGAMSPEDDPRLLSALIEDGRFRFIDRQADELLARELGLVEAGYVDRATAAAAGRRLASRYVIAGTMTRGEREAECFLRLVHCDSGRLMASVDAYVERSSPDADETLFAAAAGRLRQAFPVLAGSVATDAERRPAVGLGSRAGARAFMRLHVFADDAPGGRTASALVELDEVGTDRSSARILSGTLPTTGQGIGE